MGSILSAVHLSPGAMARLCLLALFVLSTFFNNSSANTLRVERDACEEKVEEFETCRSGAHEEYAAAIGAGDDGRPDWFARKACNYITGAVEECAEGLVGECNTEEEVNNLKDEQIEGILEQLSKSVKEWDSEKCPPIKAYLERKSAAEDVEETPEGVPESEDSAAQEKEEETDNDPEKENTEVKDDGDQADSGNGDVGDQADSGNGDVADDSANAENTDDEEQTNEDGGGDKDTGDESNEGPESGSEAAAASLSLVLVMYKICSA